MLLAQPVQLDQQVGSYFDGDRSTCSFLVRKLDENFDNVSTTGSVDVDFDMAD